MLTFSTFTGGNLLVIYLLPLVQHGCPPDQAGGETTPRSTANLSDTFSVRKMQLLGGRRPP